MEKLVELMEANSDLAKGACTKPHAAKKWAQFAEELNSLGPPTRSIDKWIKVWTDFKSKTKKKKTQNSAEFRATGGGPNKLQTLSSIEESVVSLLEMDVSINPPGRAFGLEEDMVIEVEDECENITPNITFLEDTPKSKSTKKMCKEGVMAELLELKKAKNARKTSEWEMKKKWKEEGLALRREELAVRREELLVQRVLKMTSVSSPSSPSAA